jgi:CRP-like cAMP-binding protein
MNTASDHPLMSLVDRLSLHSAISPDDCASLLKLPFRSQQFESGNALAAQGELRDHCSLLVSGIGYRYKTLSGGLRQIVGVCVPGEILDLKQMYLHQLDGSVRALTQCQMVSISHLDLRQLIAKRPNIEKLFLTEALVELSRSREWLVTVGRRNARARVAHLLCELAFRLDGNGSPPIQSYLLPMTQEQLGDALGLTSVHVNRTLKSLVADGSIARGGRWITILDWANLASLAGFDSRYLHVKQVGTCAV